MAKNKKNISSKSQTDNTDLDQEPLEEGDTRKTAKAGYDEEEYEADQSRPGMQRNDRRQTDTEREGNQDDDTREAARETGHEPVSRREKELNVGAKVIRDAKRKSQAPASNRVTRKEPSKASARGDGKSRTASTTRSGMQGKKRSAGRNAAISGNKRKAAGKSKSKSRTTR